MDAILTKSKVPTSILKELVKRAIKGSTMIDVIPLTCLMGISVKENKLTIRTTDNKIPQPEIIPTMTHEEYLKWKELTDPKLIDNFAGKCEPYDKGLKEITEAPITDDERLTSLTKEMKTFNENSIYYNVVEWQEYRYHTDKAYSIYSRCKAPSDI